MSLVEKALRKAQAAQGALPPSARVITPEHGRLPDDTAPLGEALRAESVPVPPEKLLRVNQVALRTAGMLAPEHETRLIANQFRQIKRPLLQNALAKDASRDSVHIMVASAFAGEGKTFTTMNLALSIALEKEITVLLVDADAAKPHISKVLRVEEERGLTDTLLDPSLDVESLILPTDIPNLSVLPAGRPVDTAAELFASLRMEEVMAQIGARHRRRIVIYDSSPLLLTAESRSLAQRAGQIVLVVRAGVTPQSAVLNVLGDLGSEKFVGIVLNQSHYGDESTYGYGNRTPYGEGAGRESPGREY